MERVATTSEAGSRSWPVSEGTVRTEGSCVEASEVFVISVVNQRGDGSRLHRFDRISIGLHRGYVSP